VAAVAAAEDESELQSTEDESELPSTEDESPSPVRGCFTIGADADCALRFLMVDDIVCV
jgi:hypothetical protein